MAATTFLAVLLIPVILIYIISLSRRQMLAIVLAAVLIFTFVASLFTSMAQKTIFVGVATQVSQPNDAPLILI
jgi:hypothetical protein